MIEKAIHALSEPRRREILSLIEVGELASSAIAAHFDITAPAVSQHLKVLEDAGLVTVRRAGTKRYYRIRREGFHELKDYVDRFWDGSLQRLKEVAEAEERSRYEHGEQR